MRGIPVRSWEMFTLHANQLQRSGGFFFKTFSDFSRKKPLILAGRMNARERGREERRAMRGGREDGNVLQGCVGEQGDGGCRHHSSSVLSPYESYLHPALHLTKKKEKKRESHKCRFISPFCCIMWTP